MPKDEKGGFIVRTQAECATDEEISADQQYLRTLWTRIQERIREQGAPSVLYTDLSLAQRVLRDMVTPNTQSIIVDSRTVVQEMKEWAQIYTPSVLERISHHKGSRALFDTAHVDEEINRALSRRVDLKSGGYLIIDQTEALTTVDVNTGGFVGGRNFDDTIFKTNLEAAIALARQLRLRNLGGIIILDFIDMDDPAHRESVLQELQKALAKDRTRVTINGFSQLGLVEMTRKRTRDSLAHQLCEPCPTCQSRGSVRTARTRRSGGCAATPRNCCSTRTHGPSAERCNGDLRCSRTCSANGTTLWTGNPLRRMMFRVSMMSRACCGAGRWWRTTAAPPPCATASLARGSSA